MKIIRCMVPGATAQKVRRTVFFVILGHFLPFDPPNNPKNQNFEKIKKITGDTLVYHK